MIDPMQMAIGLSIAAFLISLSNLVYMHIHGHTEKTNNRLFLVMLYILLINSICGIVSTLTDNMLPGSGMALTINKVFRFIYFLTHSALCPVLYFYTSSVVGISIRENKMSSFIKAIPFLISEIFVLLNPFIHMVWYVDETGGFHRLWGEGIIYLAAALYYIMTLVLILFSWQVLTKKRKTMLVWCFFMVLIGVLLQLFIRWLRVEVLFEAISFTFAMISIENEDDRMNATIGVYNRSALRMDMDSAMKNYSHLYFDVIRITNSDIIARITGYNYVYKVYAVVADYLKTIVPGYCVYSVNPGVFVLMLYHKDVTEKDDIVNRIDERFMETWHIDEVEIPLLAIQMVGCLPIDISSTTEAFSMMESPLPTDLDKTILEDDDLDYLLRRAAVEAAVSRGLDAGSFEVYYQPTYYADEKLHGAEALLRMHDAELGNIFPDEFIPIAEQMGLIDNIDDFVLHEVCEFISTGIPEKCGMECINVNLSVLECMKPGFVDHILDVVESYGVDRNFINFEITESVSANDYKLLSRVIHSLKNVGFLFSMDDYGTGYSNINAIFSLNLDIIKIDKSILWEAEKSRTGAIILENSIRMMRQMEKKILVEGVETASQVDLLKNLGVDYLQGYYFSKPIPKKEFIDLIEKTSA